MKDAAGNVIERIKGEESDEVVGNAGLAYEQQITASNLVYNLT